MPAQEAASVFSLIEAALDEGRTGCFEVFRGPYRGLIHLDQGRITHAELFGKRGPTALFDLLQWEEIAYDWHEGVRVDAPDLNLTLADLVQDPSETAPGPDELPPVPEVPLELREPPRPPAELYQQDITSDLLERFVLRLDWKDASGQAQNHTFEGSLQTACTVGSSADCGIYLREPGIEPLHCSLLIRADSVEVWDLGTDGKTAVNGTPVEQAPLYTGDTLTLGSTELLFSLGVRRRLSGRHPLSPVEPVQRPKIAPGGPLPKKAVSYASLTGQKPPSPGLSKTLKKLFFRTTHRVRKP